MPALAERLLQIVRECSSLAGEEQAVCARSALAALLAESTLNPTGDDPQESLTPAHIDALDTTGVSAAVRAELGACRNTAHLLQEGAKTLVPAAKQAISECLHRLAESGCLHEHLVEKFRIAANREFLDKGLHNAASVWQMAMVANWALNDAGLDRLAAEAWARHCPGVDLRALIHALVARLRFRQVPSLRAYRKDAMHHYPRVSPEELAALKSDRWRDVIDLPSDRRPVQDVPFITPFTKQGDIEHSLYRHYLMPDLLQAMRDMTPARASGLDFEGPDREILYSLPVVIQQAGDELYEQVKATTAAQVRTWAQRCASGSDALLADAFAAINNLWDYRRTPAAQDCGSPVDNLVKGFTATIRNAMGHCNDVNFAATHGSRLDPLDVSEKFVLFASVSNGQLDNLAAAHERYLRELPDPSQWDNETFFRHFLTVNRDMDLHHIQAHFLVDKTRGCPAIPQLARFHAIVLDLVLEFAFREFGEENLRTAGGWFLREKTPAGFQDD